MIRKYQIERDDGSTFEYEVDVPESATDDEVISFIRSQVAAPPVARALVPEQEQRAIVPMPSLPSAAISGATFGLSDELANIGARLGYGLAELTGQVSPERTGMAPVVGSEAQARQRATLSATREAMPLGSLGAELGGSLLLGGPAASMAKGPASLAGISALEGGIAGAGAAEDNRLAGGVMGAGLGGLLGGAVPAAGYVGRQATGAVGDMLSGMRSRMMDAPATRAGRILSDALQAQGVTPVGLQQRARQLGPQSTLAEQAGEAGMMLGQGTIQRDPTGRARIMAERVYGTRMPGMTGRIRGALERATGISERLQPSLDAVRQRQKDISGPLYKEAYDTEIPLTNRLKSILMRPPMQRAWQSAKESIATRGEELPPWFTLDEFGNWEKSGVMPSMRAWQYMKEGIDDLIEAETDAITGRVSSKGRDLVRMKSELLEELDDINPAYREARRAFAGDAAIESAMRKGESFLSMKTRDVHQAVKSMEDSEREAFLTGAVEAMREKIGRAKSGEMGVFKFLENENAMEKLRAVFPKGKEGTKALAELARMVGRERTLAETRNMMLRGSQTALRQAAGDVVGEGSGAATLAEIAQRPITAGTQTALSAGARALGRERQPTIDTLAQMLFQPGMTDQVIAEMRKRGVPQETIRNYLNAFSRGSAALAPGAGLGIGGLVE